MMGDAVDDAFEDDEDESAAIMNQVKSAPSVVCLSVYDDIKTCTFNSQEEES